jgi:enoyl-CoA hydratase/carnithine racemase
MTETPQPALLCEIADGIATLTISNPAKRNAMTNAMWQAFPPLLERLAADPAVRVLIVQGAGDTFCAGADVGGLPELLSDAGPNAASLAERALASFCKPSLAAVAGYCLGGGVQVAVACDLRFAAEDATFGITPAKLGVVYQASALGRLVELVGRPATKQLIFSARLIDADHACATGLVDQLVPAAELSAHVRAYAQELVALSQLTLQATKSLMAALGRPGVEDLERAWRAESQRSGEAAEGMSAFAERRAPRFSWTGSGAPGSHPEPA